MENTNMKRIRCIAAMDLSRGIGKNNDLPWRLRSEMKYFTKITLTVKNPGLKNVAVMGRKTWDSIPPKYRPLADRINIVLSKTLQSCNVPEGVIVLPSLQNAIEYVSKPPLANEIENVYITGGSGVYEESIKSPHCERIYLTRIMQKFDCDVFFPEFDEHVYKKISDPDVPEGIQEEKGIQFEYGVYEREIK